MSETPRDAVEQLKQETAAQLDFAADLKAAIAHVRKNHGKLAGETLHDAFQYAAEALATDFAFRLAEHARRRLKALRAPPRRG